MAGKGDKRRPEAEWGLFDEGFMKLDWDNDKEAKPLTEKQIKAAIRTITGESDEG